MPDQRTSDPARNRRVWLEDNEPSETNACHLGELGIHVCFSGHVVETVLEDDRVECLIGEWQGIDVLRRISFGKSVASR